MKIGYLPQKAFRYVDRLTDSLTSYKLVYWVLWTFVGWAALANLLGFGRINYKWYEIILSAFWLIVVCWVVNELLARFLNIAKNNESYAITALILALIMTPAAKLSDLYILAGAGVVAVCSKYLLTFRRSHIFNPAAFGAFIMGALFHKYASWWVGTSILTPVVFVGGWLILRKMKRYTLVTVFLSAYFMLLILHLVAGSSGSGHVWHHIWQAFVETQILFFAYIMLTEPMTSPTTRSRYLPYAVLVALCYGSIYWHIGSWSPALSPEQSLLIGNVLAFLIAFSPRYPLKLEGKIDEAQEIKSFVYSKPANFRFAAGQYMEWTLPINKADSRGNRRYLTISSSPTEDNLMFTLRLPQKRSSYKEFLANTPSGSKMLASRLAGSFVLPNDKNLKLAFLAGGVGITPYRSMVKYMLDSGDMRDSAVLYAVNTVKEIAFKDVLLDAKKAGIKTFAVVSDPEPHWGGLKGHIDDKIIKQALPDYHDRLFYVSGPLPFVRAMETALAGLDVPAHRIKTDYFPGYA